MATPDIRLVVGVDTGLSFSSMRDGINEVIQRIEKENPPKIKIQFDDTEINKKIQSLRSQITEISNQKVSIGATGELQSTLTTISSSLESLSQKIVNIGDSANFNNLAESLKSITPVIENLKSELASLQSATQNFQGINLNIGFSSGNSLSAEGAIKRSTISELREQASALEEVYMRYTKTTQGLVGVIQALKGTSVAVKNRIIDIQSAAADPTMSLNDQITALQKYINIMQEGAKLKGIDISSIISKFSASADEMVNKVNRVVSGEQSLEDQTNKLREIFGSGVNSETLDAQLTTINDSINKVSNSIANLKLDGSSLNSFVESANKLSETIDNLISTIDNFTVRNTSMSEGITSVARAVQKVSVSLGEYNVSLNKDNRKILSDNLPLNSSEIDNFVKRLDKLSIAAKSVKARWEETAKTGQKLTKLIIDGSNAQNDAVKYTIEFDKKTGEVSKEFTEVVHKAKAVKEEIKDASNAIQNQKQSAKVIDFTIDTQKVEASLATIRRRLSDLKEPSEEVNTSVSNLESAFERFNTAPNQDEKKRALEEVNRLIGVAKQRLAEQEKLQRRVETTDKQSRQRAIQDSRKQNGIDQEANNQKRVALELLAKITKAQQEWTKARSGSTSNEYLKLQTYSSQLNTLLGQYASKSISKVDFSSQVKNIGDEFIRTSSIIRTAGEDTKTLADRFGALSGKFSMWFSTTRVIMMVYTNIRKMISASIELDKSMNQLQIVTKENDEVMTKFGDTAAAAAKRIGSSITDFVSSATTYARLGYSLNESSQLAEFTAMLQNVGDIDVSEAQDAITSIVKAFNIGTDQIESVMDKMVVSGNNFPISVSQIAEGMKNASSALAAAGNSFDQSVALLTAANTTINLCRVA